MGLYDSFWARVKCPYCGKEDELEIQTKELKCCMDSFKLGDDVNAMEGNHPMKLISAIITEDAYCKNPECEERFLVDLVIEDGKFKEIKNIRERN